MALGITITWKPCFPVRCCLVYRTAFLTVMYFLLLIKYLENYAMINEREGNWMKLKLNENREN